MPMAVAVHPYVAYRKDPHPQSRPIAPFPRISLIVVDSNCCRPPGDIDRVSGSLASDSAMNSAMASITSLFSMITNASSTGGAQVGTLLGTSVHHSASLSSSLGGDVAVSSSDGTDDCTRATVCRNSGASTRACRSASRRSVPRSDPSDAASRSRAASSGNASCRRWPCAVSAARIDGSRRAATRPTSSDDDAAVSMVAVELGDWQMRRCSTRAQQQPNNLYRERGERDRKRDARANVGPGPGGRSQSPSKNTTAWSRSSPRPV